MTLGRMALLWVARLNPLMVAGAILAGCSGLDGYGCLAFLLDQ